MTRKLTISAITFLIAILTICAVSKAQGPTQAISYRMSEKSGESRFVLDLSAKPDYKISIWNNPPRLVIDIKNTSWNGKITEATNKNFLIKKIRHNRLSNNKLQMVLDLKAESKIKKHSILPPKNGIYRLVVDIEKSSPAHAITKPTTPIPTLKNLDYKPIAKPQFIPIPKLKKIKLPIIAIDAGHGGRDPGTIGDSGSQEKDVTLAYSFAIAEILENTGRYQVILTRNDDKYIDLKKRVEISRNAKADMFLSVHADSHKDKLMKGISIYTLSEKASDKESEALAQKENNAGVLNDIDLAGDTREVTELLIDLVQRETKNLSAEFAEELIIEIEKETAVLHNSPHRFAGFRVLTAPDIPSALLELGYLSNPQEEKTLLSQSHKKKLAEAIVRAIDRHFKKYPVG